MITTPSKFAILFLALFVLTLSQVPVEDEVTQFFQGYPYKIYSGKLMISYFPMTSYVHYVYYQSQRDHQKDPLFLWMAGGPGCSSMTTMMQENGPLRIQPGSTGVSINPNAWNQRANLLFFELPLGVGYSLNLNSNQTIDDDLVSGVGLKALNIFFNKFPSLKKNDFFMGGSGYASNYVTNMGIKIIEQNEDEVDYYDKILLKGVLYGNPCMYPDQCYASGSERQSRYHYEFLFNRGFYPKSAYYQYLSKCAIEISPFDCYLERQNMDKNFNATNTSAYNIYSKCYKSSNSNTINTGCEDQSGVLSFFNSDDFKSKWNIEADFDNKTWEVCSLQIWNEYRNGNGSYHLLPYLLKKNIRTWIYSGDMDSTIPTIGTQSWIQKFREEHLIPIKKNWREWWVPGKHKYEDQVGGFIWELESMTFVSVKGAGFKAAYDQPVAMTEVFNGFLQGETLPYKS